MELKIFLEKLNRIKDIPTLPTIVMEINRMIQDDDVSIKQISQTIEKDQAITSKILKLVNSAFFGLRSKVKNASEAIVFLGMNSISNIVVSVSLIKALSSRNIPCGFSIPDFWKHSVAVALTSKYISESTGMKEPETCFTGGLLHDIGKVILLEHFPDLFQKILLDSKKEGIPFRVSEEKESPVGHDWLGGYLAEKWKLPQELIDIIKFHHTVSEEAKNPEMVMIVHSADIVVNYAPSDKIVTDEKDIDSVISRISKNVSEKIIIKIKQLPNWYPDLFESIEEACRFFINQNGDPGNENGK